MFKLRPLAWATWFHSKYDSFFLFFNDYVIMSKIYSITLRDLSQKTYWLVKLAASLS